MSAFFLVFNFKLKSLGVICVGLWENNRMMKAKVLNGILVFLLLVNIDYTIITHDSANVIIVLPWSIIIYFSFKSWNKSFNQIDTSNVFKLIWKYYWFGLRILLLGCFQFGLTGLLIQGRWDLFPLNNFGLLYLLVLHLLVVPYSFIMGMLKVGVQS